MTNVKKLIKVLLEIRNEKEMADFLKGLLTKKELEEIPKRIEIVEMLKKGVPQRKIAEKLGMGIATVTRGSSEIKKGRFKQIN